MAEGQLTYEQARDAVLGLFQTQLANEYQSAANDADEPVVFWDNLDKGESAPVDRPWFRVTVRHTNGEQTTLQEPGSRRFSREGLVTVQIFVPAGARGLTLADRLGKMATDAFEGRQADGVWFRNVRLNEVGNDEKGAWYQANVIAEFYYEQTK